MGSKTGQKLKVRLDASRSDSWTGVRDAVDALGGYLRGDNASRAEQAVIGARLGELAEHPKWEVRKAAAHALAFLRNDSFASAVAKLLCDDHSLVREAAKRTIGRRKDLDSAPMLREDDADARAQMLSRIEMRYGLGARRAVERLAAKEVEAQMNGVYHEIVKSFGALRLEVESLYTVLQRDRIDRRSALSRVDSALSTSRVMASVLDALRQLFEAVTPQYAPDDLRSLVEEVVAMTRDRLQPKLGELAIDVDIDPALVLEMHRSHLRQAFMNVFDNALQSYDGLERKRTIRVEASVEAEGRAVIRIIDQGCGMNDTDLAAVFKPYTTNKKGGMGFGLAYTKKIVEQIHRGWVHAKSERGSGTTIEFVLPLFQDREEV